MREISTEALVEILRGDMEREAMSFAQACRKRGWNYNTVWQRLARHGYKFERRTALVKRDR